MTRNHWFEIVGTDSELCGEEFFVALDKIFTKDVAFKLAREYFPNEHLVYLGWVNDEEAEAMGLDTY